MNLFYDPSIDLMNRLDDARVASYGRVERARAYNKPATIGTDMDPLDRKLSELSERITRLERRNTREDRDVTEGRRLVISVLKLLLRRLESE